jgi:hypothetical protein
MNLSSDDIAALRLCAARTWQHREAIGLAEAECDQVLAAWQIVGDQTEAEAAARLLAARAETARKQATFDQLLSNAD